MTVADFCLVAGFLQFIADRRGADPRNIAVKDIADDFRFLPVDGQRLILVAEIVSQTVLVADHDSLLHAVAEAGPDMLGNIGDPLLGDR